ncbi:hypothetical protein GGD63_000883 [Bradyrhizobium sp. cir1]|uniref:hypothetical protein n=1 Tax=Bradyrhizobium sp. cir1 TaxID=1445730 RepID=UPI001606791F|nr:hypothetical protein [Bradyrhizobium sp. cir1]MBB4368114.1 hypothetical protein [Bradyrhizobium sp. cir1]
MIEIVRDAATAFSVVEQGALLDVHAATTREGSIGPCAGGRNSAMALQQSPGKNSNIFTSPRNVALEPTFTPKAVEGQTTMYDACQLATAILAIAFTALLLVTGQRFIEYRLQHEAMTPIVAMATLPP